MATRFDFQGVRTASINEIRNLPNLTAVQKIVLSRELGIRPDWVTSALQQLVRRTSPLSEEEAHIIGMDTFVLLAGARERYLLGRGRRLAADDILCNECIVGLDEGEIRDLYCRSCEADMEGFRVYVSDNAFEIVQDTFQFTEDGRLR